MRVLTVKFLLWVKIILRYAGFALILTVLTVEAIVTGPVNVTLTVTVTVVDCGLTPN